MCVCVCMQCGTAMGVHVVQVAASQAPEALAWPACACSCCHIIFTNSSGRCIGVVAVVEGGWLGEGVKASIMSYGGRERGREWDTLKFICCRPFQLSSHVCTRMTFLPPPFQYIYIGISTSVSSPTVPTQPLLTAPPPILAPPPSPSSSSSSNCRQNRSRLAFRRAMGIDECMALGTSTGGCGVVVLRGAGGAVGCGEGVGVFPVH